MDIIKSKRFGEERALYNQEDIKLIDCRFEGIEDGESALKECTNIQLENCYMDLRYPFWHDYNLSIKNSEMTTNCRAALWYSHNVDIKNTKLHGIKALRECSNIKMDNVDVVSNEFGWKCKNIEITNSIVECEYLFLLSEDIILNHFTLNGKYSFQYVKNMKITNSYLKTKDAFWHTENVTVEDSIIEGEYLAWYSKGLTLINCKIIGTQPLCYCEDLKLINCEMVNCDLAFEYSNVEADIKGHLISIKNPTNGKIVYDECDEIILDHSKYALNAIIEKRK